MPSHTDSPPIVNYYRAGPHVEHLPDGGLIITVPTRRSALLFASYCAGHTFAQIITIPLVPLAFAVGWCIYMCFGKSTPRAVIRVTRETISLETSEDGLSLGWFTKFESWNRADVSEFRGNRFGSGLYFRIAGKENRDFLIDLPREWTQQIEAALAPVLDHFRQTDPSKA